MRGISLITSLTSTLLAHLSPHSQHSLRIPSPRHRISPLDGSVIALPTPEQLAFQSKEIGLLIHFNIATYISSDGCNDDPSLVPNASIFDPQQLDTDQWMETALALEAKTVTLVVKHNCGFTTWPTDVRFQERGKEGSRGYEYSVAQSPVRGRDVVREFVDSARKYGLGYGFYYSTVVNNYLNVQDSKVNTSALGPGQVSVTQETYDQVVSDQLKEIWAGYPEATELWFDGGYSDEQMPRIVELLQGHQTQAVVFNGCTPDGICLSDHPIRWIGNEDGRAPLDTWSTGLGNDAGNPTSPHFCPAECDTTLQTEDRWFYGVDQPLRSFEEMKDVYHQTVGRNCFLELDLAPDRRGLVPEDAVTLYRRLGAWIRKCYDHPVGETLTIIDVDRVELYFDGVAKIDRLVLMEDQRDGQVIRQFEVFADLVDASREKLAEGRSVGNKRIVLLDEAVEVTRIVIETESVDTPRWKRITAHLCE